MGITNVFFGMSNYTLQDHNPSSKANGAYNFGKGQPLIKTMILHVVSSSAIVLECGILKKKTNIKTHQITIIKSKY